VIKSLTVASLALVTLTAAPARAGDQAGAKAFVVWLYGHYPKAGTGTDFRSLGNEATKIFDSSLLELIKEDEQAGDDLAPDLPGDPICDCQNNNGMIFTVASVSAPEFSRATAKIVRRDMSDPEGETITLDLAQTKAGWRVYDVAAKDMPSLRTFLMQSAQGWKAR
jgi:hypothetical protein